MIKQFLRRRRTILKGIYFTYLKRKGVGYNPDTYWDQSFYTSGVSDRQTISSEKNQLVSQYHYSSVELQILKHFFNHNIVLENSNLIDIGSGSGHWINFYLNQGVSRIVGIDVSKSSVEYLTTKYATNPNITLKHGKAIEQLNAIEGNFDIVNAIGVMFHIVDDQEWKDTIKKVADLLPPGGIFVVGGAFGLINGLNVQIDRNNHINKRLRSKSVWKKTLIKAGFSKVDWYRNNAYLFINDPIPQNNILIATK